MSVNRDGAAARVYEPAPETSKAGPQEGSADALPRTAQSAVAAEALDGSMRFYHHFDLGEHAGSKTLDSLELGFAAQLTAQFEHTSHLMNPLGIAHLQAFPSIDQSYLSASTSLAASLGAGQGILGQFENVFGSLSNLHERHQSLSDFLGVTRTSNLGLWDASQGVLAPLQSFLDATRSFERLDAGLSGMFPSVYEDSLRRDLVGSSLSMTAALQAWDQPTRIGILAALPNVDAVSLAWLQDSGGMARIRAALVHAEHVLGRGRRTRRIELPPELRCDNCDAPFLDTRRAGYITLVGAPPGKVVPFTTLCRRCAGTGEEEALTRALAALAARNSLRNSRLYLEVLQGGGRGNGVPRGRSILRLAYRRTRSDKPRP